LDVSSSLTATALKMRWSVHEHQVFGNQVPIREPAEHRPSLWPCSNHPAGVLEVHTPGETKVFPSGTMWQGKDGHPLILIVIIMDQDPAGGLPGLTSAPLLQFRSSVSPKGPCVWSSVWCYWVVLRIFRRRGLVGGP
jgi:hypothetical protein